MLLQELSPGYKDVLQRIEVAQGRMKALALFESANAAYDEQKWDEALTQFEELRALDSNYEQDKVVDRIVEIYLTLGQQAVSERPASSNDLTTIQDYFRKILRLKTGDEIAKVENDLLEQYLLGARSLTQGSLDQGEQRRASMKVDQNIWAGCLLSNTVLIWRWVIVHRQMVNSRLL